MNARPTPRRSPLRTSMECLAKGGVPAAATDNCRGLRSPFRVQDFRG